MARLEINLRGSPWMARGCFASVLIAAILVPKGPAFGKPKPYPYEGLNSREARGEKTRIPVLAPARGPVVKARPVRMAGLPVARAEVIPVTVARAIRYEARPAEASRVVARATVIAEPAPAAGPEETRPTGPPEVIAASPLFPSLPSWDREPAVGVNASVSKPQVSETSTSPSGLPKQRATLLDRRNEFRQECIELAREGLSYKFGSNDPKSGGLDCSGTVQYLLQEYDISDVPRQSNHQYHWLEEQGTLKKVGILNSGERVLRDLKPGDLLFWKDTYNAHRHPNVTHVMVYLGWDRLSGKHKMFGARGSSAKGDHGHAVDVFDFNYPFTQGKGEFIAYGSVPGLRV